MILSVGLTFVGLVTTQVFNVALARSDFANESVTDWFRVGSMASVKPAVTAIIMFLLAQLLRLGKRIVCATSARARQLEVGFWKQLSRMTRRTRLDDPSTLGACLLLLSIATLAVTWWYFSDLLGAVFTMRVANATTRTLTFLAPSSRRYQELYREVATYIAVGLVVVWYWFAKYVLRTSASLNNATLLGGLFVVCVSIVTLNAPYRLLLQPVRSSRSLVGQGKR